MHGLIQDWVVMKSLCEGVIDINYHQVNVAVWLKTQWTSAFHWCSILLSWPSPALVIGERAQACNHLLLSNKHTLSPNNSVEIEWSPYNGNNYSSTKEAVIWRQRAEAWKKTSGFSLQTAEIVPQPAVWVLSGVLVLFSGRINKMLHVVFCTVKKTRTIMHLEQTSGRTVCCTFSPGMCSATETW